MKIKTGNMIYFLAAAMAAAALFALAGCGGSGGGSGGIAQAQTQGGSGKLAATVKLTGRVGGRFAAGSATATVNVTITISGIYSETNTEFATVTTTYPVNLAQGYARVSILNIPVGVNHLITAVADWGSATETVKAIIPEITQNIITTVTADQAGTAVADAAILYAQRKGVRLADVSSDTIASFGRAVEAYAAQVPYADMTPENVLVFLQGMNVPAKIVVSPASATIMIGETTQFAAQLYDANNTAMATAPMAWGFSPAAIGSINNTGGLFTAAAAGFGTVTASYLQMNATAAITVVSVCRADTDCNDGLPLTLDACNNPGTLNGSCIHIPIACNTNAECNDNQALTIDTCTGGGTVSAACLHTPYECNDALDCNDNNALTIDTCSGGGALGSACGHAAIACNIDNDCTGARHICLNGGALIAACVACSAAANCDDNNPLTQDACTNAGTVSAACTNTAIVVPDTTAPTVSLTVPVNGAAGVPIGNKLNATFSEAMNPLTLTTTTFTLKQGATPVAGTVTYSGVNAVFTPAGNLGAFTLYTATITTGATDLAGNALSASYTWSFTTSAAPDTTAPTMSLTVPVNGAPGVPISNKLTATFSEAMDPLTLNATTFTLKQGATAVAGAVTYSGVNATFTPAGNLTPFTLYTATITTGATDLAGNGLAASYTWSFTTGAAPDITAPMVTLAVPVNGASGVPIGNKLTATFSEAMDPLTLTTTTFTLRQGVAAVPGTVTYSGVNATFTPTGNLLANTLYTATITAGATDLAGNGLAASYSWSFTTGAAPDTTAPTVTLAVPVNGAASVPIGNKLTATFSETMDPLTLTTTTFTLLQGLTAVAGTVTYSGVNATFTPAGNLTPFTLYTATITTGATDLAGNGLAASYTWSFTTGAAPDITAPMVTLAVPVNGASGVPIGNKLNATFSETMDPLTLTTTTFTLMQGGTAVAGTVTYSGVSATFTPAGNLLANTLYTAAITTGATDLAGNGLAASYSWSFTTGAAPDITAPTMTHTVPADGATGVPIGNKLMAAFSETMDPLTLNTTTFTLLQGGTVVSGTVTYSGVTATFTPASNLLANTLYTATFTTGAADLAGNGLSASYTWSFITGAAPDTTAPTVTLTVPVNGASGGVPISRKLTATFSEALDPLTLTTATFVLMQGGATVVTGTVTYSGVTAVFAPDSNLAPNTLYTATITTGATDLAGNALASDYVWNFTTASGADTTPPTVTAAVPANAAAGVPIGNKPTITFSEAMDPLTLNTTTFTLMQGATPVAGTVTYSGETATFTPAGNLAGMTTYTATITTGARDLAGNALAGNHVWTFTTVDITVPTVLLTVPADADLGMCVNKAIDAMLSEAMDPLTLNTTTFTLMQGTAPVAGTVTYSGMTAKFAPTGNLLANTPYTATITTGAADVAGNALAVNKVWAFTTGITTCAQPINLGAAAPFMGFGGGAGMTNTGILTAIGGDIGTTGASTMMTGFHDSAGDLYTVTGSNDGNVNGRIYTGGPTPGGAGVGGNSATFAIAAAAANDALIAYNSMSPAMLPGGVDPGAGQLAGLTLAPGIYKSAGGTFNLSGADLTLDAQGDPNAVWVFQTATGLNIGVPGLPRNVILINGAQARNVFWYVGTAARIEDRSHMAGTIIAAAGVTISTAGQLSTTTLDGRALGLNASVTMVNTLINMPGP